MGVRQKLNELQTIINKIRRVKYGDKILPEDHNLQTDAIKKIKDILEEMQKEIEQKAPTAPQEEPDEISYSQYMSLENSIELPYPYVGADYTHDCFSSIYISNKYVFTFFNIRTYDSTNDVYHYYHKFIFFSLQEKNITYETNLIETPPYWYYPAFYCATPYYPYEHLGFLLKKHAIFGYYFPYYGETFGILITHLELFRYDGKQVTIINAQDIGNWCGGLDCSCDVDVTPLGQYAGWFAIKIAQNSNILTYKLLILKGY